MRNYILVFTSMLVLGLCAHAQSWNSLSYNGNQPGLESNPLKGFATLWQPSNNFPHSIQGKLFGLDEIMSGPNAFDWAVVDSFLSQEAAKGNHCYLQVNVDPGNGGSQMPTYLINQVAWQNGMGVDSCPDWNDPDLVGAMLTFIDSFGTRYNSDPRVFLVHFGLYGMWGEWHIGNAINVRPEFAMTKSNKLLLVNAFSNSFPDQHLLARFPEDMPDPQEFGYSDGLFFDQSISPNNPYFFHNVLKNDNADLNWMRYPIGGEVAPPLQAFLWDTLPNQVGQDILACLDSIRPTWLFAHHLLTVPQPATSEWDNAILTQKLMGYTFHIDKYRLSSSNGQPAVEVNIQNKGLAPMYANWDLEIGVLDSSNQFQSLGITKWNLDLIQPDALDNYRSFTSDSSILDGTYTVLLRVVNPLEAFSSMAKVLSFANTTQDEDVPGWLTLGELTLSSGNAGTTPTPVSGISLSPSTATMQVGDSLQLSVQVFPSNATNPTLTWVSDHPATASVDSSGLVFAGPVSGTVNVSAYSQDGGFQGNCEITVEPFRTRIPALIEAEDFLAMSGIVVQPCQEGGENLSYIDTGDWMDYAIQVDSTANFFVDLRVASQSPGGEITMIGGNGDTLDIVQVTDTSGWQTFSTVTSNSIALPAGNHDLRLLASGGGFNLNWIEFYYDPFVPLEYVNHRSQVDVYPNPTQGRIALEFEGNALDVAFGNMKVFNVFGADVAPETIGSRIVDLTHLPNGIYFLKIEVQGEAVVKKVVKY